MNEMVRVPLDVVSTEADLRAMIHIVETSPAVISITLLARCCAKTTGWV
jgi:hypothetical protein